MKLKVLTYGKDEDRRDARKWLKTRPKKIREMIRFRPMTYKYSMAGHGDDYYIPYSYNEDGTMQVTRIEGYLHVPIHRVFGVDPKSLINPVYLKTPA